MKHNQMASPASAKIREVSQIKSGFPHVRVGGVHAEELSQCNIITSTTNNNQLPTPTKYLKVWCCSHKIFG